MNYLREIGGDLLITVYHYSGGISGTNQVSTPVVKVITGGRYCLKANGRTITKGRGNRVGGWGSLIYLDSTTSAWADIHGQPKASTWSASIGWLFSE